MDEAVERRNGNRYLWATAMIYLAAPVYYVDVTQATLCAKLGASHAVANLPASINLCATFAPIIFTSLVPLRLERRFATLPSALISCLLLLVGIMLVFPLDNSARIAAVIAEALCMGLFNSVSQIYLFQCLSRGTSEWGRARAMKLTFTVGPLAAVAGSLGTQFILDGGIPSLVFPRDFALIHFYAVPCAAVTAWCCSRFELEPMAERPRVPFFRQLSAGFRDYCGSRSLIMLFFAYLLWNAAVYSIANLSLYTKVAMGREPADFAGVMLALRFGCKALAGFGLGLLNLRYGYRAPLIATVSLVALAMAWALAVPGYSYLGAFGLMGAGELAGVYFPNVIMAWSPAATAARDLSLLNLAGPSAGWSPALYGWVTDRHGFPASFVLCGIIALASLGLVFLLPARKAKSAARG